jgi:hypothetical protein
MEYRESHKDNVLKILYFSLSQKNMEKDNYILVCQNDDGKPHQDVIERFESDIKNIKDGINWLKKVG